MAFVSSSSSTNEVNTADGVSNANTQVSSASTQVSIASTQVSTANLSDATVYAFLANQPNWSQLVHEDLEQIHEDDLEEMDLNDTAGYDKSKTVNVEETSSKAMVAINGAGFDWSFMADEEAPIDMALMAFSDSEITDNSRKGVGFVSYNAVPPPLTRLFSPLNLDLSNSGLEEFQQPEFEGNGPKTSKSVSEGISNEIRKSPDAPLVEKLGHPQKEDQGYVDSGCSRHMTGNMSYLSDFKEFDGGYVTFGGGAKGGRITGKGTLKTGKLDFEDVYFVKELQFNLFSVSQMCDKKNSVLFTDTGCFVLSPDFKLADESQVLLKVPRKNNMYSVDMKNIVPKESLTCLVAKATLDESMLWHMRLGHVNFKTINKLVKVNLVKGLLIKHFEKDQTCVACLKGKQHKVSSSKDETSGILKSFITQIENLVDKKVKIIKCDNETEFKNRVMSEFCEKKGIKREFSVASIPQQNGVAERRNRTLIEAARTMLADSKLPTTFWAEAVNTACYVHNRVLVVKPHNKTPYELFRGRTPSLSFMKPFGCHVTILNTLDHLVKFDGKSDDGFFVGYSLNSKAFRVYNIRTRKVEENFHVRFLEDKPIIAGDGPKWLFDIDVLTKLMNYVPVVTGTNSNDSIGTEESAGTYHSIKETGSSQDYILMPLWKDGSLFDSSLKNSSNDEPQPSNDAGKKDDEVPTAPLESTYADFFSDESKLDLSNIATTYPVPSTPNTRIHKDHSLDHGYTQEEGIDYDEVFAPVARIDAIRLFLAYASFKDFVVYQMDVKSAFLYGKIEEEVYVCQPLGFQDPKFPDKVYKVEKALYGLHQAPRAWYETLSTYLLDNGFKRGQIDKTLFIKRVKGDILLVQVYVDDIIFGSTRKEMCTQFEKMMHKRFQMSSMGELTFFLGLQVTQKNDGIFISQDKYVEEILKKFGFSTVKTTSTPMETSKPLLKDAEAEDVDVYLYRSMIGSLMYLTASRPDIMFAVCTCARFQVTPKVSHLHAVKRIFRYLKGQPKLGLWYPKDSPFDLEVYTDSDYAGASLDRKSTTEGCQFLGRRFISWQCKKQTIVVNSTTEAEYVVAAS
ncbi:putative ribonuclease H-like domain-containing protein [Tanacetum coccineum]|uniref:Ribonuclease H-like domain-containing protein n=1 Tax=Tanacetum coccineum TaxID=301880 RepID=A0ABQ5GHW5_9ASTR